MINFVSRLERDENEDKLADWLQKCISLKNCIIECQKYKRDIFGKVFPLDRETLWIILKSKSWWKIQCKNSKYRNHFDIQMINHIFGRRTMNHFSVLTYQPPVPFKKTQNKNVDRIACVFSHTSTWLMMQFCKYLNWFVGKNVFENTYSISLGSSMKSIWRYLNVWA